MRPVSLPQSAIRSPLNTILGTEANVRLLRVLASMDAPATQTALAKSSGLNASGVGRSLSALEEMGVVEFIGAEGRKLASLRDAHPVVRALRTLFKAERSWFDELVSRMREVAKLLSGPPAAVWIEGPVAAGTDSLSDPICLGVLATGKQLPTVMAELEDSIDHWSQEFDVTVEPRGLTMADLEALSEKELERLTHVIPLLGPPPLLVAGRWKKVPVTKRTHAEMDAESLRRGEALAAAIQSDPEMVKRALATVRKRLAVASAGEQRELREWERILTTMSLPRLRRFLAHPGERATRLRQTSPFDRSMTPDELFEVAVESRAKSKRQ